MSKFETLKNNPKQRNIILFGIGLGVLIAASGVYMSSRGGAHPEIRGGAQITDAPNVKTATGASNSALYNEKVEQSNKLEANKALEQDKTFVATPVNKNAFNSNSPIDDLDKQIKATREKEKEIAETKAEEKKAEVAPVAQQAASQPMVQQAPQIQYVQVPVEPKKSKKYGTDEDKMLIAALSGMQKIKTDLHNEQNFHGQNHAATGAEMQQAIASVQQAATSTASPSSSKLLDKAGTIYNAVLETGINSDEPSPVLAKIVSGPLKGTRLIGKMVTSGEKVIVEFKTASIPSQEKSYAISAIAVDPNSSRTGLASNVDNHYFLKYGVLLGAAFLGGYSDALATQNTTTTQNADGSVLTTRGQLSNKQITEQAFGSVGKELANQTRGQIQTIKPTITVNAGSAVGILLMEDFYLGNK